MGERRMARLGRPRFVPSTVNGSVAPRDVHPLQVPGVAGGTLLDGRCAGMGDPRTSRRSSGYKKKKRREGL